VIVLAGQDETLYIAARCVNNGKQVTGLYNVTTNEQKLEEGRENNRLKISSFALVSEKIL